MYEEEPEVLNYLTSYDTACNYKSYPKMWNHNLQYLVVSSLNLVVSCLNRRHTWYHGFSQVSRSLHKKEKHQIIKEKSWLHMLNINPPWCIVANIFFFVWRSLQSWSLAKIKDLQYTVFVLLNANCAEVMRGCEFIYWQKISICLAHQTGCVWGPGLTWRWKWGIKVMEQQLDFHHSCIPWN